MLASPGIEISVQSDTSTQVRATATDASNNVSACSDPLEYIHFSGTLIASDTAAVADPTTFWGQIACDLDSSPPDQSGHFHQTTEGDPHKAATGAQQGDDDYRRLAVFDGDDYYGERCELGENDHDGPVTFYGEGDRLVTYLSIRLPETFPASVVAWQSVMQMKQTQPADNGGGTPIIELDVWGDKWRLRQSSSTGPSSQSVQRWSTEVTDPSQSGGWTRFAFGVVYSKNSSLGSIEIYVDLNGDGDFGDASEYALIDNVATLKEETAGSSSDGLTEGDSIPSHLRAGIYHNSSIPCTSGAGGCSIEIDNVQVVEP